MVDLRQFQMKTEWLQAIGKAQSAIRFECGQSDWHTPAARTELGRIADTLAEIEQAAIHPAEPEPADGWVKFSSGYCRDFGNVTACVGEYAGGIACCHFLPPDVPRDSIAWAMSPDAPRNAPLLMEWLDAAYAAHLAAQQKPVLVWDDDEHCGRSHSGDATYLVTSTRTENDKRWFAHLVDRIAHVSPLVGGFGYSKRDEAKAACERHAKGE